MLGGYINETLENFFREVGREMRKVAGQNEKN